MKNLISDCLDSQKKDSIIFKNLTNNAKFFIFHGKFDGSVKIKRDIDMSLPFDECFFYFTNPFGFFPNDVQTHIVFQYIHIKETGPLSYNAIFGCKTLSMGSYHYANLNLIVENGNAVGLSLYNKNYEFKRIMFELLQGMIASVNQSSQYGKSKQNESFKKGFGVKAFRLNISEYIHINRKGEKNPSSLFGTEIDWSHRWTVRGHWRKYDGIGKNRAGERDVSGFTWVVDHIKGPDDAPIINKIRIISADNKYDSTRV